MRIPVIILILLQLSRAERDLAPVFVIDYGRVLSHLALEANPFYKIKSSEFLVVINEAIKRVKVVIVFMEETFCNEDISLKDKHGSPFYHLSQALREKRVQYMPAVYKPFKTLKSRLQPLSKNVFHISDSSSKLRVYDTSLQHFYIYFKDKANETRASALRRHDLLIKEIYFVVDQIVGGPVVAFYTGKLNPIMIETINYTPVKTQERQKPGVMIYSTSALFMFIGVFATLGTRRSMYNQIPLVAEELWEQRSLITRMVYTDFELEFTFEFDDDRWTIDKVALLEWGEEVGRTDLKLGAPWGWSYMCSDPLVLVNMRDGSAVTISHYQIEPFNYKRLVGRSGGNGTNDTRCFGPAVNCGPYFNAHILAGLMVSSFCMGILAYGVVSLFNIHANSRYDDPTQQALVIMAEGGGH